MWRKRKKISTDTFAMGSDQDQVLGLDIRDSSEKKAPASSPLKNRNGAEELTSLIVLVAGGLNQH